jgi:integral membrane protein (TIGR00529 family)
VQTTLVILVAFAGMLALSRLRLPLGAALVAGGLALDAWSGASAAKVASDLGSALVQADVWLLLATTALLLEFGRFLSDAENERAILAAARNWGGRHGRAMSVMVLPAAVGLVPMPGGALVSAPLVDKVAAGEAWTNEWKSAVNYWFRHVWEYWWPIYPVVVVTLSIFHVPTWQYMATLIPFSFVSAIAGYVLLVRPHLRALEGGQAGDGGDTSRLRALFGALVVVVGAALVLPPLLAATGWISNQSSKLAAMLIGMSVGLAWLVAAHRGGSVRLFASLLERKSINQLSTIGGVMVFQYLLEDSGLLPRAGQELVASGIPLPVVVALLPLLAGFVTGVAAGFAGAAFPLVVGLLEASGGSLTPLATLALAFGFGYAGMMLSPVHLCFILTSNYFCAPMAFIYRHVVPCVACLMGAAVGWYAFLRVMGW